MTAVTTVFCPSAAKKGDCVQAVEGLAPEPKGYSPQIQTDALPEIPSGAFFEISGYDIKHAKKLFRLWERG